MSADRKTVCECVAAGFCPRHRCNKTDHFAKLCRERPEYFDAWERGEGPCVAGAPFPPAPRVAVRGLGDVVARGLRATRLDRPAKAVVRAVKRALGATPAEAANCGCGGRQQALNEMHPL